MPVAVAVIPAARVSVAVIQSGPAVQKVTANDPHALGERGSRPGGSPGGHRW